MWFFDASFPEWLGAISTVLLAITAGAQLLAMRVIFQEERRPRIDVKVRRLTNSRGQTSIYLVLGNNGATVASNVSLSFPAETKWKSNGSKWLAFESKAGLTSVSPNAEFAFFLGAATENLVRLYSNAEPIQVEVKYRGPRRRRFYRESAFLTLRDEYGTKRKRD